MSIYGFPTVGNPSRKIKAHPNSLLTLPSTFIARFPHSISLISNLYPLLSNPFFSFFPLIYSISIMGQWWLFSDTIHVGGSCFDYSWQEWPHFGSRSLDVGTRVRHRMVLSNDISQGTIGVPRFNRAMAVLRPWLVQIVLPCIEFLNEWLVFLGHLKLATRDNGPKARYCSWASWIWAQGRKGL